MAIYSVLKANKIIDRVQWDGITEWEYPFDHDILVEGDIPIGSTWDGENWQPPVSNDWLHPDRPFRFTAPLSLLFVSPTWIAFSAYADKKRIPWVNAGDDSVTYYLQEIYPEHQQLLTASGITIENRP